MLADVDVVVSLVTVSCSGDAVGNLSENGGGLSELMSELRVHVNYAGHEHLVRACKWHQ